MGKKKSKKEKVSANNAVVATNRRARHDYNILDTYECGVVLVGTEVKALREGKTSLNDAFATIDDGEVWLRGLHIPEYSATATPSIHTKIKPTGAKLVKLVTASEIICWRYSAVARFSTAMISPVAGSVACIPMAEPIHDETTMTPARTTKSQKGLGSILPTRSRVARKPPGCSPFACDDGVFTAVSDMIRSLRLGGGVGVTGICGQD